MACQDKGMPIIHVIDDEPTVRSTLHKILASAGFLCRSYETGKQFLAAGAGLQDCVVADVHLPDMNGIALLDAIHRRGQATPVLVITGHATVELAVEAMKAGAIDFLAKPFANADLLDKIEACLAIGRIRAVKGERRRRAIEKLSNLSERETEVLSHVIEGKTNKAISDILNISIKTVEAHRSRIMEKTGALSLVDLTRLWDAAERSVFSVSAGNWGEAAGV